MAYDTASGIPPVYPPQETARFSNSKGGDIPSSYPGHPYSPALRQGLDSTPDAEREGAWPVASYEAKPDDPGSLARQRDASSALRESETVTVTGGIPTVRAGVTPGAARFAPLPNSVAQPESRWTQQLSPHQFYFSRDMVSTTGPKRFNGMHSSMASMIRNYDIYGMTPARRGRNTISETPLNNGVNNMVDIPQPVNQVGADSLSYMNTVRDRRII